MDRGKIISRYRILDRIADGGMGEVYRAKMETLGGAEKVVALKVVRKDLAENDEFASLFIDEARLAMGLSHANIVQSFDAGRIDNQLFLAMEYVSGFHLGDLLQASERHLGQPIPQRHLIYIAVEVLKGLDYAHRRVDTDDRSLGIVHRDVSPGNILISFEGEVKVADFGIAKSALRSRRTTAGRVKGKLPYIAPEQLRESGVDRRTDLYSLGSVMYEALTDRWLVDPNDTERAIQDVLQGRFATPREIDADIPEALEAIVLRALSTEPGGRYPTAPAMRQELEQYALSEGYLLSSADLADFLAEICSGTDEWTAVGMSRSTEPPRPSSPSPSNDAGPFNDLLGAQLRKLDTADTYSVFTTDEVSGALDPSALGASTGDLPIRRGRRLGWTLAFVGLVAAAVVFGLRGPEEPQSEASAITEVQEQEPPTEAPTTEKTAAANLEEVAAPIEPIRPPAPEEVPSRPKRTKRRATAKVIPVAAEPAFVSVNSDPWSYVVIDGERIRATPLRGHRVTPGRHQVILRNPEAGLERRFEIEVKPGESKRLSVDLRGSQ
ncbi:MAG: protein kinase [Myxococcales bacterium]|nr:protein kinase [Myxococcales bacterium]